MPPTMRPTEFLSVDDRRREPRLPAEGEVRLFFDDGGPVIHGRLLDVSSNGFRAAHECPELRTGMELGFARGDCSGRARIMWNRTADGRWESGFFVVERT